MNRLSTSLPAAQLRDALRPALDSLPDIDLLDRYARYADHPAFETLLRRHGPMVFGVCRRVLANHPDAEDAFQATFLVFVRKARSLRRGDRLGPWLYGVACRVAMKARSRAARVATTEATDMIPDPTVPAEVPDWLPVLDAELNGLPAKYRDAIVLCELEGVTRADAARALGLREGTLSSRLARGRELLRRRLLKHGTLLPAGGVAALVAGIGRAAVPVRLLTRTGEAAKVVTGVASSGVVPVGAARLTDEVLKDMFLTKLRAAGGAIVALAVVAVGLGAARPDPAPGRVAAETGVTRRGVAEAPPAPAGPRRPDREALQGVWVVEKIDGSPQLKTDELKHIRELVGNTTFLVAGDVWWAMVGGPVGDVSVQRVALDPTKNPKWLDMGDLMRGVAAGLQARCIYELDGDRLRFCMGSTDPMTRPAEFSTDDAEILVWHLRRGKAAPGAGEPALLGSWAGAPVAAKAPPKGGPAEFVPRVEILDGYLFAFTNGPGEGQWKWIGGRYTVDTTKNPRWVDVELTPPLAEDKANKLYGSYEVIDGRLKMAFGTKRITRPLEFKDGGGVLYFDLKAAAESPGGVEWLDRGPAPGTKQAPGVPTAPMPSPAGRPAPKAGGAPGSSRP